MSNYLCSIIFCLLFLLTGCGDVPRVQVLDPANYGIEVGKTTERDLRREFRLQVGKDEAMDVPDILWLDRRQFHVNGVSVIHVQLDDDKKVKSVSARYSGVLFEELRDEICKNRDWIIMNSAMISSQWRSKFVKHLDFLNSRTGVRLSLSKNRKGWTWLRYYF